MPDLDHRFAELRADIAGAASGPDVPELARRSHRRNQRRAAGAAVVATVALGGLLVIRPDPTPVVLTPPAATPTKPATNPGAGVPLGTLIYGSAAAKPEKPSDRERWRVDKEGAGGLIELPGCSKDEPQMGQGPALTQGTQVAHTLARYGGFGGRFVDGSRVRYEQLLLSTDEGAAKRQLASLVAQARNCRSNADVTYQTERLNIGDEAWLIAEQTDDGEFDPSIVHSVIARQGRAIAIFYDRYGPESGSGTTPMATVDRHKSDARQIATRLCQLGFGCRQ